MGRFGAVLLLAAVLAGGCVKIPEKIDVNLNMNGGDGRGKTGTPERGESRAPTQLPPGDGEGEV